MTTLAIELNDAGIRLANRHGILATEPGCALVEDEVLAVGSEAFRSARLKPHQASDRFWTDLSLEPLSRRHTVVQTTADIAFAQLSALWRDFGTDVDTVVLVVPASFTIEQLGLLLGIAEACGIPVAGIVDAAVASSEAHPERDLLHLEIGLHQAVVTRVEQHDGISRGPFDVLEGVGLAALRERWVRLIAGAFVAQTRFDPLHNAHAEQALYDGLPVFLDAAARRGSARVELTVGERHHVAEVPSTDLAQAAKDVYAALAAGIERLRPQRSGAPDLVQIGPHAAALPHIAAAIAGLPGIESRIVRPEAACLGALSRLGEIQSPDGRFKLVTRLSPPPQHFGLQETAAIPSRPGVRPTHLVYGGWVRPIGVAPVTIGAGPRPSGSGVAVEVQPEELGGDAHCVLRSEGDRVVVEDPAGSVLLNGERVAGHAELRVGDVLRLGGPGAAGATIHLVALVDDECDGA
jgi:hypothetical protein